MGEGLHLSLAQRVSSGSARCCFKHDCCYGRAEEDSCAPKTWWYPWECQDGKAKCGELLLGRTGQSLHPFSLLGKFRVATPPVASVLVGLFPFADDIEDKCQKMACECDRSAAKCLAKAPYNVTYLFWPDTQCGEKGPTCPDD